MLIRQGKQDPSQDNQVYVGKDIVAMIIDIQPGEKYPDTMVVKFRLMDGEHKGKTVRDFVSYAADSQFAWKYRSLRKAAGVPYVVGESEEIDIDDLLMNKVVQLDLSENKKTDGRVFQNFAYKALTKAMPEDTSDAFPAEPQQPLPASPLSPSAAPKEGTGIVDKQGGAASWNSQSEQPKIDDDLPF